MAEGTPRRSSQLSKSKEELGNGWGRGDSCFMRTLERWLPTWAVQPLWYNGGLGEGH